MRRTGSEGFTLIEMLIVSTVLVPILFAIVTTSRAVTGTIDADDVAAEVTSAIDVTSQRLGRLLRSGVLSTFKAQATQADVDAATADYLAKLIKKFEIPLIGDWIAVPRLQWRQVLLFQSADGRLSFNASALTTPRILEFVRDPSEIVNGADDDGDGMVDEGKLYLTYEGNRNVFADRVEQCGLRIDGDVIEIRLQYAKEDGRGRVHRAVATRRFQARNK